VTGDAAREFDTLTAGLTGKHTVPMSIKTPKKALNPAKLARSLSENKDGSLFLKSQVKQEKRMSVKLSLPEKSRAKLHERHSFIGISNFFNQYASVIKKQHYLYQLPPCNNPGRSATFQPNWCDTEKQIYTLDSHSYCLFTRKEYKAALSVGVSKGISLSLFLYFFLTF